MFLFKSPQVLIVSWLDPIESPFYPNIIRLFVVFFPVKIHGIPPGVLTFQAGHSVALHGRHLGGAWFRHGSGELSLGCARTCGGPALNGRGSPAPCDGFFEVSWDIPSE